MREPRYPMPLVMRDEVETAMVRVTDRGLVGEVRRLVAVAYAHGWTEGYLQHAVEESYNRMAPDP